MSKLKEKNILWGKHNVKATFETLKIQIV